MATIASPFDLDLQFRGFITGSIIKSTSPGNPELCRYFGGIPYALPPVGPFRFTQPRALPACYRYGTRANPGVHTGKCGVCPQARASKLDDEDCLQLNIWIPTGTAPDGGWPVYFYIHGGYLQFGGANGIDPVALLSETPFKAIFVMPAYRLNVYGFIASKELLEEPSNLSGTVGNLGFWDQRLALQWTYTNISYFNGNPSNITVAGYSAGAHSVFYQLAHDLDYPPEKRIIKRVIMHANGPGVQPKQLSEHQEQFDELLDVLKISKSLPPAEKLRLLRKASPAQFRKALKKMNLHEFRALNDGHFISTTLFQDLDTGAFARKLLASNVHVLIGESANENFAYATHRTPRPGADALYQRLLADYPRRAVDVLKTTYFPGEDLPRGVRSWKEVFGRIYADVQVHATSRGFIDALARHGAGHLIHRYRLEFRSSVSDKPKAWGATHWGDNVIWFFGDGKVLPEGEKEIVRQAFTREYAKFVAGEEMDWKARGPREARRLKSDGSVDVWRDELWDEKLAVWRRLQEVAARQSEGGGQKAHL